MEITLLDGSIGQELVKRSGKPPTTLWSTSVMMETPELVDRVHDLYFEAGATVATTNTYCVLEERLARSGLEEHRHTLWQKAIQSADGARRRNKSGRIAGAIGPLFASYQPDRCPPALEAAEMYQEIVNALDPECDVLLIETMSSIDQARGALIATENTIQPVWIAFSVNDYDGTLLRSGEKLKDVQPLIDKYNPAAVLVNCSRPESVTDAVDIIREFGLPFGAYANGFTEITKEFLSPNPTIAALSERIELTPDVYADFALTWVEQGATIVGGCCEVGPDHIREIYQRLIKQGHRVV